MANKKLEQSNNISGTPLKIYASCIYKPKDPYLSTYIKVDNIANFGDFRVLRGHKSDAIKIEKRSTYCKALKRVQIYK